MIPSQLKLKEKLEKKEEFNKLFPSLKNKEIVRFDICKNTLKTVTFYGVILTDGKWVGEGHPEFPQYNLYSAKVIHEKLLDKTKVKEVIDRMLINEGDLEHQGCIDGEELKKELGVEDK